MTTRSSDVLKAYFPEPGDTSPRAVAIMELRQALAAVQAGYSRIALHTLKGIGHPAATPHDDNTGRPCRFDPLGHDCCATCNDGQEALARLTSSG